MTGQEETELGTSDLLADTDDDGLPDPEDGVPYDPAFSFPRTVVGQFVPLDLGICAMPNTIFSASDGSCAFLQVIDNAGNAVAEPDPDTGSWPQGSQSRYLVYTPAHGTKFISTAYPPGLQHGAHSEWRVNAIGVGGRLLCTGTSWDQFGGVNDETLSHVAFAFDPFLGAAGTVLRVFQPFSLAPIWDDNFIDGLNFGPGNLVYARMMLGSTVQTPEWIKEEVRDTSYGTPDQWGFNSIWRAAMVKFDLITGSVVGPMVKWTNPIDYPGQNPGSLVGYPANQPGDRSATVRTSSNHPWSVTDEWAFPTAAIETLISAESATWVTPFIDGFGRIAYYNEDLPAKYQWVRTMIVEDGRRITIDQGRNSAFTDPPFFIAAASAAPAPTDEDPNPLPWLAGCHLALNPDFEGRVFPSLLTSAGEVYNPAQDPDPATAIDWMRLPNSGAAIFCKAPGSTVPAWHAIYKNGKDGRTAANRVQLILSLNSKGQALVYENGVLPEPVKLWANGRTYDFVEDGLLPADFADNWAIDPDSGSPIQPISIAESGAVVCTAVDADGNGHVLILAPWQVVTKSPEGDIVPVDFAINGHSAPTIVATVAQCQIDASGTVTVAVSGTITDATSDLIDDPSKKPQSIILECLAGQESLALIPQPVVSDLPWRPYGWSASFNGTIAFQVSKPGFYPIQLTTDVNAAGLAATTSQHVEVKEFSSSLLLNAIDPTLATVLTIAFDEEIVMTRGGDALFRSDDETVSAEILSVEDMSFDTKIAIRIQRDGQSVTLVFAGSQGGQQFEASFLTAQCADFPATDPGFIFPLLVRFPACKILEYPNYTVRILEETWRLRNLDFGDGTFCYVVDESEHPVVFNPQRYAQTSRQTKPISEKFLAELRDEGITISRRDIQALSGLLCREDTRETDPAKRGGIPPSYFADSLDFDNNTLQHRIAGHFGPYTLHHYQSKRDVQGRPLVTPKTITGKVKPEILWRLLTTANGIAFYKSFDQLKLDVDFRESVVWVANNKARIAYIGDGTDSNGNDKRLPGKRNLAYWLPVGKMVLFGREIQSVRDGVSTAVAIGDAFSENASLDYETSLYAMACAPAAIILLEYALSRVVSAAVFNRVMTINPLDWGYRDAFISFDHADQADWLPGDFGYLRTNDGKARSDGTQGENMIYLGGSFALDFATFKNQALFWGQGMNSSLNPPNILTLANMISSLEDAWNAAGEMKVEQIRTSLNLSKFLP